MEIDYKKEYQKMSGYYQEEKYERMMAQGFLGQILEFKSPLYGRKFKDLKREIRSFLSNTIPPSKSVEGVKRYYYFTTLKEIENGLVIRSCFVDKEPTEIILEWDDFKDHNIIFCKEVSEDVWNKFQWSKIDKNKH